MRPCIVNRAASRTHVTHERAAALISSPQQLTESRHPYHHAASMSQKSLAYSPALHSQVLWGLVPRSLIELASVRAFFGRRCHRRQGSIGEDSHI